MTVGRMLREMTVREFALWRIRYAEQPWGTRAADILNAHWMSLYANVHRDPSEAEKQRMKAAPKREQPFGLAEFVLFDRDPQPSQDDKHKDIVRPETRDWFYRVAIPAKATDGH